MKNATEISFSDGNAKINSEFSYSYNIMFLGRTDKVYEQYWNLLAALHNGIVVKNGVSQNQMFVYSDPKSREIHPDAGIWKSCFQAISKSVTQYIVGKYPLKKQPTQNFLRNFLARRGKL